VRDPEDGEEVLLFASEVRALLASGAVPRRVDPSAVASYLWHGFVVGPDTIVEGVSLLPAASVLTVEVDAGGEPLAPHPPRRYWAMPASADGRTSLQPQMEQLLADPTLARRAGLCGESVQTLWRSYVAGRPGLYWSRVWAIYALLWWCQSHEVSVPS
jgi:asparagine synthetase B (glutamine-hydrolysing)